jgi:archaellum component FlaF (FlaF/FlaG flagellin family)
MVKAIFILSLMVIIGGTLYVFFNQNVSEAGDAVEAASDSEIIRIDQDNETCSLQKNACVVTIPQLGQITFEITPREIRMNTPLILRLTADSQKAAEVWVDFLGVDINMGYNRVALKKSEGNVYLGEATLPVCSTGSMTWQATILLKLNDQMFGVPFEFITEKK